MSRVRFHSYRQDPVALPHWETAHLFVQCVHLTFDRLWAERVVMGDLFRHSPSGREDDYRSMLTGAAFMGDVKTIGGQSFELQTVVLNTALASDKHRLAARIAGQHEIHCFVEGPNRRWFAEQIKAGLESGSLRPTITSDKGEVSSCGWEDVLAFLSHNERYPVVLSGSVTDSPGSVSPRSRFMEKLREQSQASHLEMEPETWEGFRFGDGQDSSDMIRFAQRTAPSAVKWRPR